MQTFRTRRSIRIVTKFELPFKRAQRILSGAVSNEPALFTVVITNKTMVFEKRFETKRLGAENAAD